jgi:hypothetical protein
LVRIADISPDDLLNTSAERLSYTNLISYTNLLSYTNLISYDAYKTIITTTIELSSCQVASFQKILLRFIHFEIVSVVIL